VIHAHPVFASALSVAGLEFPPDILPEGVVLLGEIPTTAFTTPSSTEDADVIRGLIGRHDALLLRQYGTLTCGVDLAAALNLLERIEHVAEVFHRACSPGNVERLSAETRRRLQQVGDAPDTR
jgi:L-fuculose-phosphate aldolase